MLGEGGMATVYLAHDLRHDRRVAIKVLKPELATVLGPERFLQEARITAKLDHPHILTLIDSGEAAGVLYYVLPYVRGESLRAKLDHVGQLPISEAIQIVRQVASALEYAHQQGVVHRDIKPENILMHQGEAVVTDFGIARAYSTSGTDRLTATGIVLGTPAYMSIEQMMGEREVDGRADQYALATVLFECLTGQAPYRASTVQAIIGKRVSETVPSARAMRPEIPDELDAAIKRALAPVVDDRFPTIGEFADACEKTVAPVSKRRRPLALAALVVAMLAFLAAWPLWVTLQRERARASLPQIALLVNQGKFAEAYEMARRAARQIPDDSMLSHLMPQTSDQLSITSEPTGAEVTLQRFVPTGNQIAPVSAGTTPIKLLRVARGDYRVVIKKQGFAPIERMASSAYTRAEQLFRPDSVITVQVKLEPGDSLPTGMLRVPGGDHRLMSPDAPANAVAHLDDFAIDRYEVTNQEYSGFLRAGGYTNPRWWHPPFREHGKQLSGTEASLRFMDRTGLPGPRSWSNQEYQPGMARHPVTDISWYEAEAYCEWKGRELPTLFQWEQAGRSSEVPHAEELVMPWGAAVPREPATFRANLGTTGTTDVGSFPFGISPYGAYDMAGNVKEWTRTAVGEEFVATGGSYEDPVYLFARYGLYGPFTSSRTLGFRCAKTSAQPKSDQGSAPLSLAQRTPTYQPVRETEFRALLRHYQYDRRPLQSRVIERITASEWTREKIQYLAANNDSVFGYLYLPRQAAAPYQTIVFVASSGAFYSHAMPDEVESFLVPHIKAGRAVWATVFKGMIGREWEPNHPAAESNSVQFRDEMVLRGIELRTGLDYLETRSDIDMNRLAYLGLSWGAGSRSLLAGVDDRFHTIVFVGGGIDERLQPTLPEASNINFAPYLKPPKLLLNGHDDEENTWLSRGLPFWNLLREPKKLVLINGAGHVPLAEDRVPAINAWLDQTLGPVRHR